MKLANCINDIFVSLLQQFEEGIVVTLIRQLNQILLHSACVVFHYHTTPKEINYGK
jgi:hypothetical protein